MPQIVNVYCDESCHLQNDAQRVMVLGAVSCDVDKSREIAVRIREIGRKHGMSPDFEIKWAKVSSSKLQYYMDVLDYFFDDDDLRFRGVVAHKANLNHGAFAQSHDDWYYKMMYLLLTRVLAPGSSYRIYLDKKDTRSGAKVRKLHDVLSNSLHDFDHRIVERVQIVESHAVAQMQLADLLLGALSYVNRELASSEAKLALVARIRERTGYQLTRSTLLREEKFNVFHWKPQAASGALL